MVYDLNATAISTNKPISNTNEFVIKTIKKDLQLYYSQTF